MTVEAAAERASDVFTKNARPESKQTGSATARLSPRAMSSAWTDDGGLSVTDLLSHERKVTTMIDVRRAASRFHTNLDWLNSWHSFSFGSHYDEANTHHGLLLVSNDDRVAPGGGFGTHPHRDMEIVTWVLSGRLLHRDSEGNEGEIYPGLAQRMSAGSGITHSEENASTTEEVHFVQMWVTPDAKGIAPGYEQRDLGSELESGGLHPIASGQEHPGAVTIHQRDAVLWGGRIAPGDAVPVPVAPHVHLFVARGATTLGTDDELQAGDAVRLTDEPSTLLTAGAAEAEVLIWATA